MKFNFPINNFSSGEWSPKMAARTEVEQYPRSCERMKNFIAQIQGGAAYRPGFLHSPWNDQDAGANLTIINDTDTVYSGFDPKLIPLSTNFNGIALMCSADNIGVNSWFTVRAGFANTDIEAAVIVDALFPNEDVLNFSVAPSILQHTSVGDLTFIVSAAGNLPPQVARYVGDVTLYSIKEYAATNTTTKPYQCIPWDKVNALSSNVTMNPSATTGSITLTASAAFFDAGMVGTYIRLCNGTAAAGVALITAYTNSTTVTATVIETLPNASFNYGSTANASSFWQISAWNNSYGWPKTVTAFQGRVIFAGSDRFPDTVWGSRISNVFMFEEIPSPDTSGAFGFANAAYTADNSRPFTLTPNAPDSGKIVAMSAAKTLVINTDKCEIVAYGSNGALGPNNAQFESSTSYGASDVQPVRVNNFLTFVQNNGRKVRDMIFSFSEDQYKSSDLSFVAEHLFRDAISELAGVQDDSIVEMVAVQGETSVLYIRTANKRLLYVTLDRDYQVNAWGEVEIGVSELFDGEYWGEKAACVAMCVAKDPFTTEETLMILTLRGTNAAPLWKFEILQPLFSGPNPIGIPATGDELRSLPCYLDYATVQTSATLEYEWDLGAAYANEVVSVVADGNYIGEFTCAADGDLDIGVDYECRTLVAGFIYEGLLKTSKIEQGGQVGVPQGRHKKIDEMVIKLFETGSLKFGPSEDRLDELEIRTIDQPMSAGIEYFTGDKAVIMPAEIGRSIQVVIKQDKPYPAHVIAVVPKGVTYD